MGRLRIDRVTRTRGRVLDGDGRVVVARCHRADRPLARTVGLLFTADLRPGEGVWLEPCSSVHAFGLRAAIGCAFLDRDGHVLRVVDPMRRWTAAGARGARVVVEAPAGTLAGLRPGDRLTLDRSGP